MLSSTISIFVPRGSRSVRFRDAFRDHKRASSPFCQALCCGCVAVSIESQVSRRNDQRSGVVLFIGRNGHGHSAYARQGRKCRSIRAMALMWLDLTSHMFLVFRNAWCAGIAHCISAIATLGSSRPNALELSQGPDNRAYVTGPDGVVTHARPDFFRTGACQDPEGMTSSWILGTC